MNAGLLHATSQDALRERALPSDVVYAMGLSQAPGGEPVAGVASGMHAASLDAGCVSVRPGDEVHALGLA
ncbi:MAG: hypothetical protein IJH04_08260 [Eggerthellaceae bacterium]|nr:hypothetical protein [Eggerthellaceae bacterium]